MGSHSTHSHINLSSDNSLHCEGGLGSPQWVLSIHHNFEYDEELISLNHQLFEYDEVLISLNHQLFKTQRIFGLLSTLESEKSKKWPVVGYVIDQDKH